MKSVSGPLLTLLNGNQQFRLCDLYTITLVGGGAYYLTSWDVDVPWNGHTFLSASAVITRTRVRTVIGVEVDELTLTVAPAASFTISGVPFLQAVRMGLFDGASVQLERAYMTAPPVVVGTLLHFIGAVSETRPGRTQAEIKVKSELERLNIQMPRRLYQAPCLHTLFDADCGLTKATYKVSSTASAGSTTSAVNVSVGNAAPYFSLGTITFTSGVNAGVTRTIKQHSTGVFALIQPLPAAPAAGDAFDAYPGCDKQQSTCTTKFSNVVHFLGMPYVPIPETAI
jgi:uncharacterized phage protein (TIGR02218 family)